MKIFISYRRDKGIEIASRVKSFFEEKGEDVFLDYNSIKLGKFDKQIYSAIEGSDYFILILTPNALDNCCDEEDWVQKEITHAIKNNITIIPLVTQGFKFPKNLPEAIDISTNQGFRYDPMLFDTIMEKIYASMKEKESPKAQLDGILCKVEILHACRAELDYMINNEACPEELKGKVGCNSFETKEEVPFYYLPAIIVTVYNLRKEAVLLSNDSPRISGEMILPEGEKVSMIVARQFESTSMGKGRIIPSGEYISDMLYGAHAIIAVQAFNGEKSGSIDIDVNGKTISFPVEFYPDAMKYSKEIIGKEYNKLFDASKNFFDGDIQFKI